VFGILKKNQAGSSTECGKDTFLARNPAENLPPLPCRPETFGKPSKRSCTIVAQEERVRLVYTAWLPIESTLTVPNHGNESIHHRIHLSRCGDLMRHFHGGIYSTTSSVCALKETHTRHQITNSRLSSTRISGRRFDMEGGGWRFCRIEISMIIIGRKSLLDCTIWTNPLIPPEDK